RDSQLTAKSSFAGNSFLTAGINRLDNFQVPGQAARQDSPGSALLRRSFRKTFPPAVRGVGAYLWDAQGKQYLDFSGSAAVNFIGHGVSEITEAMTEQARSVEF